MQYLLLTTVLCVSSVLISCGQANNEDLTIFLVRHAEKQFPPFKGDPSDPDLNNAGKDRAIQLGRMLSAAGITEIYSTQRKRTIQTAQPLADQLNLDIQFYEGGALSTFAQQLKKKTGRILISGHSNTTPELVALLGGEPGEPINENTQFDRIYVITYTGGQYLNTVLLKYGANYD